MADVAKRAGVHVTTVSLALRNNPRLPEATRKRITALSERLGYRPDPMLQALVAYRGRLTRPRNSPTLAYVTNWTSRFGWKAVTAHPEFFAGAETTANKLGFKLEHFWLSEAGMTPARLSHMLFARGIRGLVVASNLQEMGDVLHLDWSKFSAVKIDYFPHLPALHNVTNNHRDIVRLAVQKVLAMGYRRIGLVMYDGWDKAVDHLWTAGFLCEQQHLPKAEQVPAHLFCGPFSAAQWSKEGGDYPGPDPARFKAWLRAHRPEVLLSKEAFVLPQLRKLGLRVPEDVAFADLFLEDTDTARAGVRQSYREVGSVAVEILAGQLLHNKLGIPDIPTTTFVDGTWLDGPTCPPRARPPRAPSPLAAGRPSLLSADE
jgi:LacI family transcriptional regulator